MQTDPVLTVGEKMRISRERARITQQAAADHLEAARRTVIRYERDEIRPRRLVLQEWARMTGVRYQWLVGPPDTENIRMDRRVKKQVRRRGHLTVINTPPRPPGLRAA